jgi:hypothetical protein
MGKKETLKKNTIPEIKAKETNLADEFIQAQLNPSSDIIGKSGAFNITYGNTDFGESKYDNKDLGNTFIENGDYKYHRGEEQSTAAKWGVGLSRAALKLGTRTLNGIASPIYGIGSAIKNWDISKIVDNDVTRLNQEVEAKIDKNVSSYSTKEAEDAKGFAKLAHVNFWSEGVLDGISYSGAAMLSGGVYTKALSAASKLASLDKLGMTVAEAMGATTKIEDAADKTKFVIELNNKAKQLKNGLNNGTLAMIGASTEASSEGLSAGDEFEKQMLEKINEEEGGISDEARARVKELKKSVQTATYALQLPIIAGSNLLTFGKTMLGNTSTEKNLLKQLAGRTEENIVDGVKVGYKASMVPTVQKILDKTYGLKKVVGKSVPEGLEEVNQLIVTKATNDFYSKKYYNPDSSEYLESFSKGLAAAMSNEGLENFLTGAIAGGIFGNAAQIKTEGLKSYKNPYNEQAVNSALDYLNDIKGKDAFKETVGMLHRHANLAESQDQAINNNDNFEINNSKSDMLINYVNHMVNAGKTQDLVDELNSYKKLSNEEFEQILGIELSKDKVTGLKESVGTYLNKRLDKVGKIEQLSNTLDEVYPDLKQNIKDRFMYTAWTLEDAQDRVKNLTKEINFKLSDNLTTANVVAVNMLQDFPSLSKEERKAALATINSSLQISPLLKQEILKKVNDLDKLVDRQEQFTAEYKALENPKLQAKLQETDQIVEEQVNDAVHENEVKETNKPVETPVTPVEGDVVNESPVEENPHTQWYTSKGLSYTSSEEDIVKAAREDLANGTLTDQEIEDLLNDWDANKGSQPVVSVVNTNPAGNSIPVSNVEGESQSVLRTETKNRDSNYTTFEGKTITLGELRAKFGLASFSEVQELLKEFIKQGIDINNHVKFTVTANNKVTLNLVDGSGNFFPVSIIEQFGLGTTASPEDQKKFQEVIDLFYNENGPKTVEEINKLHEQGVIKVNLKRLLNFTLSNVDANNDFIDPLISFETLESFLEENGTTNYVIKDGASILTDASKGSFTAFEEDNNDIRNGFHMVVDGISQPIKLRLKHNTEASALVDKLSEDIQTALAANASLKDIQKLVKKFNEQVFFALKPRESVSTGISLWYDDTNGLHLKKSVLNKKPGSKHKNIAILNKQAVQDINNSTSDQEERTAKIVELTKQGGMLTNINPADLSLDYLIGEINNSELTLNSRPFVETDVKYNTPLNASKKLEPSRFEAPIGAEGLAKYNVEISANTPVQVKPVQQKQATQTTATTIDPKADIEKKIKETLRNITYDDGTKPYDNLDVQDELEINQASRNIANALSKDQPLTFEFLKANLGGIFSTFNNNVIKININKGTGNIELSEVGTVRTIIIDKNNNISYDFEDKGKKLNLKAARAISQAESKHKDKLKDIFKEYDAERAALNGNTTPVVTPDESITDPFNVPRGAVEDEEAYSSGKEESTGITEQEIEAIKAILPKFITIADIKTIAKNLRVMGIPYGVFKSKVIYLNTAKGKPGTAYHEAFHAVFRTMLTDEQIDKYLDAALKDFNKSGKNMQREITNLLLTVPSYVKKTKAELVDMVLEEYLADKFSEVAQKPISQIKESDNIFKQLWFKIKEFFRNLRNLDDLDVLFSNILKGNFVNSSEIGNRFSNSTDSVFKLLPRYTGGFFSAEQSRKFVNTLAAKMYKIKTGALQDDAYFDINIINGEQVKALKTDEALLQELLDERLDELNNVGVEYVKSTFKNPENLKIALTKLNDERRLLSDDEKVYNGESAVDILKSAVLDKLNTFNFKTEDEDQEKTEYKDKFSSQEAWLSGGHESLSSTIKAYIGFSTATEIDEITGLEREVAVDEVAVYNGLIRLLADTNKENMIAKLYYATRGSDNPNVKSFYEQVLKDLEITYDPESNTVVLPENQNKINVYNAILTAFDKSNIQMINAYQKEAFNGDVEGLGWMKANTRDTAKITLDRWASNLINLNRNGLGIKELAKIEKKLNDIAVKYYSKDKITDISNDVKEVQSLFKEFGVNLTTPYIEYSLLKQKESFEEVQQTKKYFTQDQLNILKINEEIVPISWDIFEAAGGFSLVKSLDGNILNLYKGKKLDKELVAIAENNAIFDETTANFSFTNAEGERVYEIISKSDVIAAVIKFNTTDFVKKVLGDFKTNDKGVPLRDSQGRHIFEEDTATVNTTDEVESKNFEFLKQNWILNKYPELFNKGRKAGIKLNMLSGFVDTTLDKGKTKGGITYGKFDQRTYLLSSLGLFYNNGSKSNVARYQFRQNESSGTSYVVELPKINVDKNFKQVGEFFVNQFTNEYNRIKREALEFKTKGPGNLKGYNTNLSDKAFDFTEFQYLKDLLSSKGATESDLLYKEIQNAAIDGKELSSEHLSKVLSAIGITSYDTVNKKGETITEYAKTGHGMLGINFNEFKKAVERNRISDFLPAEIKDDNGKVDNFLYEFYINDYMMSYSFNELLDGDYALSRKSKDDISKRHKGGIASGNSYGKGEHNSCIIKAVKQKLTTKTVGGKLITITNEDVVTKYFDRQGNEVSKNDTYTSKKSFATVNGKEYQLAEYEPNDAQSYSSQYHMMMGALRQGRLDETTREIYKELIQFTRRDANGNIVKKINIGDKNIPGFNNFSIQHLFNTMSSFNSKKTVVFDGLRGQYLKMSEIGLVRSSISYVEDHNVDAFVRLTDQLFDYIFQDNFESPEYRATVREISKLYKPIPGMEYLHNLANQADLHEIDHIATESASKGATLVPVDSKAANFDLSKSKFSVINENKRNQVETPTGKSEVTVGSQILGIITSEQNDSKEINFQGKTIKISQLKKIYYDSINTTRDIAFKNAIRIIKDVKGELLEYGKNNPGTIDIAKLDEYVKRAVLNSGADQSLTEFFDTPFNYNMVQKLVKAEQVVLAHFSKGVLAQKTNGDKVSLVSGVGINLVREIATGKIISHHQVVKNPSKYSDATKYSTNSKLQYNVKDPVTGELYSECILSQQILTRHGLKIGDTITPEMTDVMKSLGYRIPSGDKQSAISLRVVSLLPDYYNGSGVFPDELVYLSGADFDIDSEFIQMPYFWFKKNKPTVPIKFGSEKTDEDKWEATKFYNLNYNKDFNRIYNDGIKELKLTNPTYVELKGAAQYYNDIISHYSSINKELPSDLHDLKKDIDNKIKSLEGFIYQATAKELGLPETQDQFKAAGFPNPSVVASNTGLDAMIGLLTNEYVSHITNGTTSTEEVSNTRDQILEDGFVKSSDSKIKSGNRIVHDILGKFTDNVKNSEGSQGIGPVANKIQQFAFLMSKITEGNRNIEFKEGSFTFNLAGTKGGTYKAENKDGKRIADQLNMMLNMFTDNAKDPIAGTLNIKLELLGGMTEMIMQGMSFENAVKIINIPVIQEYGELLKTLKYGKKNKTEENFSKGGTQKEAIQRIIFGEKNLETGKYVKEFTYDDLTMVKANKNVAEVSIEDIDNILKGTPSLGTQLEIFNQFLKITEQGDLMSDINTFLKLNQGLDISFTSLHHDLHKAIDNFQIHGLVGTKDQGLATVTEPHISINELLENDTNTLENIKRALFIDKQVGQKIFIEQTPLFKKELQKMFPSLSKKTVNTQADLEKISKAFLGQISSLGYQQWLNNLLDQPDSEVSQKQKAAISKKLSNLNFGLLFSSLNDESSVTLAKQLEILQAHPTTKNNYFVKYISSRFYDATNTEKFNPKFDYVETRSFVKESDATMSLLIDSVKDLFSVSRTAVLDPTTALTSRQFVDNMFSYLMVKDNMQFKNNSLSKFLPVGMFGQYSSMLDKITESFITNEEFVKNFDLAELAYNFRKIYATDINTPFGSLKFKEIKAEYLDQVLTKDGQLHFKVKGKGEEFKKNLDDMKNVFGFETEKVTIVKDGNLVFPQFMSFKVDGKTNVYELQTARTSDRLAGKVVGLEGTYKQVEKTGTKGVSLFFAGTYEKALAITDKVENTPKEIKENEVVGENIASNGSDFAKKLTNVGNKVGLTYKGGQYINSEHAYQTWKSGEFNQAGYDLKGGKVRGGKLGDTFAIMTDILTQKLKQHPELVQGIDERGGLAYIEQSTHNVIGDKFWESVGQNKFIEALTKAYENILSGEEKSVSLEANEENANSIIVVDKLDDDLENLSFDEEDFNEDEEIAPKGKPKIKKGPKKCN